MDNRRYDYFRRGKMTRWGIRMRQLRRAWNSWDGVDLADWIMGKGVLCLLGIAALLILAAWLKIGA